MPFEIPKSWVWTTLGEVCNFERGITFPSSAKQYKSSNSNIPCIRTANVQNVLQFDDLWYVDKTYMNNNQNKLLRKGDIIMSSANSRELVGKTAVFNEWKEEITFGGFVIVIRSCSLNASYLLALLRSYFLSGRFMAEATQTTNIANLSTSILENIKIPLPPLCEQIKISNKVETLNRYLISIEESLN